MAKTIQTAGRGLSRRTHAQGAAATAARGRPRAITGFPAVHAAEPRCCAISAPP